jgi:hypothetical protein
MTPTEAMELITRHKPEWYAEFERLKAEGHYYVFIAEIGHEIVDDAAEYQNLERIYKVFHTIEGILEQINFKDHIDVSSLIGAGMFEVMHDTTMVPRDFLDQFMGERTLKFWKGIIEGWYGKGIRTLSMYERIILNDSLAMLDIKWLQRGERLVVDNRKDWNHTRSLRMHWQEESLQQKEVITPERSKQLLSFFRPLIAERALGYKPNLDPQLTGFDTPYAIIKMDDSSYKSEITIGNLVGEIIPQRYVCTSRGHCYALDTSWEKILQL